MRKATTAVTTQSNSAGTNLYGMRQELMKLPNDRSHQAKSQYSTEDNDEFISSESDRQLLLIRLSIVLWAFLSFVLSIVALMKLRITAHNLSLIINYQFF